ncbi:serine hydrolase domain-containing protein [Geodermatophilus sp. SYSU D00710]
MTGIPTVDSTSSTPARAAVVRRPARIRTTAATALLATLTVVPACGAGDPTSTVAADGAATTTATPSSDGAGLRRTLGGILEAHHADGAFVGAVLALREADGTTVTVTSGTRAPGADSGDVDPDVPWNIGSVTKSFVAVAVLQLAEEGRIDLDAGIDGFLPDLAGADRITPRHLLQHTSGLGEYLNQPAVEADARREWTPLELLAVAEAAGRTGEPGGPHAYSNTNYVLLGHVIEQVTGRPWDDEVRERVVEPLGLRDTGVVSRGGAPGFGLENGQFVDHTDRHHPSLGGAAGGLQSTAADLLLFTEALADGRLLSAASQAQMTTFVPAEDLSAHGVTGHEYGLGLERYSTGSQTVIGHLGIGAAHSAFIGFDRDSGATVAVLTNAAIPGPQALMAFQALAAVRD